MKSSFIYPRFRRAMIQATLSLKHKATPFSEPQRQVNFTPFACEDIVMIKSSCIYRFRPQHRHVAAFKILNRPFVRTAFHITFHRRGARRRKVSGLMWYTEEPVNHSPDSRKFKRISIPFKLFCNDCWSRYTYHSFPETVNDTFKPSWRAINVVINK